LKVVTVARLCAEAAVPPATQSASSSPASFAETSFLIDVPPTLLVRAVKINELGLSVTAILNQE
jgi:hypothetical protein